jgi:hypothetical protein
MKWVLALACLAVLLDLAMNDPMGIRRIDFNDVRQSVENFAYHLTRTEYQEVLDAKTIKR